MKDTVNLQAREIKQKFLEENPDFTEIQATKELPSYGDFFNIEEDDEVWIMQCPKGTDITDHKLKLPGRCSSINGLESIAIEFPEPKKEMVAYQNHKGRHAIKFLSFKGSIILRNRLKIKANDPQSADEIQTESPDLKRILLPERIKQRHPLHGVNFENKIEVNADIALKIKHAERISAKAKKKSRYSIGSSNKSFDVITIEDDDITTCSPKGKKKKRKYPSECGDFEATHNSSSTEKRKSKISSNTDEVVSADLEWIKTLIEV